MLIADRTTLLKGPAYVTYDGATIKFAEDFSVQLIEEKFPVTSLSHGRVANRVKDRRIEVTGVPLEWTDLTKLFPHATSQPWDLIFGATDKPLVITPTSGAPLTIGNAAITKMPGITLHPSKSILREMTWTGLIKKAADPSAAASWFSFGTPATGVAQPAPTLANMPNAFYSATFNSITIKTDDGIDIDFNMGLEPDFHEGVTIGMRMASVEATARLRPINLTEAQYATLLGWDGKEPGDDPYAGDLVIAGHKSGKPTVTLSRMQVDSGVVNYGRAMRTGDVGFASLRVESGGALTALWTFGTVS